LLIVLAVVSVDRYVLSGHGFSHLLLLAAEVVTGVLVYGAYLMLVHRDLIEEATALIRSGVRASG
jgi:hypothetical protein